MINENPLSYTKYHYYACSTFFFIVLLPPALSFTVILITFLNFLTSLPSGLVVWGFPPKFYIHYSSPHLTHINIQKKARPLLILNKIYVEFKHFLCRTTFTRAKYILHTLTILQQVSSHYT